MGLVSAHFFSWLQGAQFYVDAHSQAVSLLPHGNKETWLDVGCGPGLVTRLAAQRGYNAIGVDRDQRMIGRAMKLTGQKLSCRFEVGDLTNLNEHYSAEVVSAASLLFVLRDPEAALHKLWDCVRPGGNLLIVETTEKMTPTYARSVMHQIPPRRRTALALWARARNGKAIATKVYESLPSVSILRTPLLHGMVAAWTFKKGPA